MTVAAGFPEPLLAGLEILAVKFFYNYLWLVLFAFVASIPAGLWAMSTAQAPMLETEKKKVPLINRKFAFAMRQLLESSLYRALYLFHFGFLPVAARTPWISWLCSLPATLGHFAVVIVFFKDFSDEQQTKPAALSYCVLILSAAAGVASLLLVETRARAIVHSGCLIDDVDDVEAQFGPDHEAQSGTNNEAQVVSDL